MPPQSTPLDIVTVSVILAGLLFDPRIAEIVGPYAVILLGAVLGGSLSAARRGSSSRVETLGYMALVIILALLVTVPLAEVTAAHIPLARLEPRVLFAPVAAIVAGIGHDWPNVGQWAIRLVRGMVERWASKPNDTPPGGQQ